MKYFYKLLIVFTGFAFIACGLACMFQSTLGMGPWGAFEIAVAHSTGLSIGQTIQLVNMVLILLAWLCKESPTLITILHMILVGQFMDWILMVLPQASGSFWQVLLFLLGMILFAFGTSQYLRANRGAGPRDGLMLGMAKLFKISPRIARLIVELLILLLAAIMKGPIGLGTVFYAFLVGPLIQFFLKNRTSQSPTTTGP